MSTNNEEEDHNTIAGKIQRVRDLCLYPTLAESATTLIYERLIALQNVLASITEPVTNGPSLQALYDALDGIDQTLITVLSMNRIVYAVQAICIQQELEISLKSLSQSLDSLLQTQSSTEPFRKPRKDYYTLCRKQEEVWNTHLKETLSQEQSRLALATDKEAFAAVIQELVGAVSAEELQEALIVLDQPTTNGLVDRSQEIQQQAFAGLMVDRLKLHPKLVAVEVKPGVITHKDNDNSKEYPSWALDPITGQLMEHPVTLRAPCQHNLDKSTFVQYIVGPNCPVCPTKLKGLSAKPNQELTRKIQCWKTGQVYVPRMAASGMQKSMSRMNLRDASERTKKSSNNSRAPSTTTGSETTKSAPAPSRRMVTAPEPKFKRMDTSSTASSSSSSPTGRTARQAAKARIQALYAPQRKNPKGPKGMFQFWTKGVRGSPSGVPTLRVHTR